MRSYLIFALLLLMFCFAVPFAVADEKPATEEPAAENTAADKPATDEPTTYKGWLLQAQKHLSQGETGAALAAYTSAIELSPEEPSAYQSRMLIYMGIGKYREAKADADKFVETAPDDPMSYTVRGLFYSELRRITREWAYQVDFQLRAMNDFEKAIELDSDYIEAHIGRARGYEWAKRYPQAEAEFTKAMEIVEAREEKTEDDLNQLADLRFQRAETRESQGKNKEAKEDYDVLIEANPKNFMAYHRRASCHTMLKDTDSALADYAKAIELSPKSDGPFNNRGNLYIDLGEFDKAIDDLKHAIELNPRAPLPHHNLGRAYAAKGDHETAIPNFTDALNLYDRFERSRLQRAKSYVQLKKYDEAIADYNTLIERFPQTDYLYQERSEVWKALGDEEKAAADLEKVKELNTKPETEVPAAE
ncbi:tetratricopeptide repeat protein [Calycomorphotria hydatis]|nr:tetratricopeptide repeat protein [Calycomorphotria hydatis]